MQVLTKLEQYRRIFGNVGILHAARALTSASPVEVAFRPSGVAHPVHLRLRTSDLSTYWKIFVERDYEFELASDPEVIVDAGANVGFASLWYANRYPRARIIAVEPESSNFEVLRRNAAPYANIAPVRAALWSSEGNVVVVDPGVGRWGFRTERPDGPCPEDSLTVRALTMDRLMADHGIDRIGLLKVDIEGAEREVFSGASSWIGRVDAIAIELHDRVQPGCSRAVYAATSSFLHEEHRGENVFMTRTKPSPRATPRP
jgi:FkbM family methyltransferase